MFLLMIYPYSFIWIKVCSFQKVLRMINGKKKGENHQPRFWYACKIPLLVSGITFNSFQQRFWHLQLLFLAVGTEYTYIDETMAGSKNTWYSLRTNRKLIQWNSSSSFTSSEKYIFCGRPQQTPTTSVINAKFVKVT